METESFSDQLRRAVDASGMSRYAIARKLGISQATMSRFMSGQRGLSMELIDRLCALLGLSIVGPESRKQGE